MGNDGGALYNIDRCSPKVDRCRFAYNIAGSWGGAMRNMQSSPKITNCNFIANSARDNGGAIFNYLQSNPAITNCTFTANTADGNDGGGMYSLAQSIPTVTNCIFRNNGGVSEIADDESITTVTYSNVTGGHHGEGNIDASPLFVDPGYWDGDIWIDGDYHLSLNSPCINKGDPAGDYDGRVDIDNDPRVMEGRADIGSDECYRIIKKLKLDPMCSNAPESARRWRIDNPNMFDVEATWQVHETDQTDIVSASPGDCFFVTDTVHGVNRTIIRWFDKDNVEHSKIKTSHPGQCPLRADLNYDGDVTLDDFAEMAAAWQSEQGDENWNPVCDISDNPDNIIDMSDLVILSSVWLEP
jgi:parallel beta-helix repeat protein